MIAAGTPNNDTDAVECWLGPCYSSNLLLEFSVSTLVLEYSPRVFSIFNNIRFTRGIQKVLQLDYIEEWKCYKLHFIFQYNLYWVQCICDIFLADC